MKCPGCGLVNPDTAQRCDCGYDFQSKSMQQSYAQNTIAAGGNQKFEGKAWRRYYAKYCSNPIIPAASMFFSVILFGVYMVAGSLVLWGNIPRFGYPPHDYVFYALISMLLLGSISATCMQLKQRLWAYAFCTVVLSVIAIPFVMLVAEIAYTPIQAVGYNIARFYWDVVR